MANGSTLRDALFRLDTVAPVGFGAIERGVGAFEQRSVRVAHVIGGHAETRRNADAVSKRAILDLLAQVVGFQAARRQIGSGHDEDKFFAAPTRQRVCAANVLLNEIGEIA